MTMSSSMLTSRPKGYGGRGRKSTKVCVPSKASKAQKVFDDEDTLEEENDPDSESSQEPPQSSPLAPVSPFPGKETGEAY